MNEILKENIRKETCEFLSCYRLYKWGTELIRFNPKLKTASGEIWVNSFFNDELRKKGASEININDKNIAYAVKLIGDAVRYVGTYPVLGRECQLPTT